MEDTKCRELTYQGYKFRIADFDMPDINGKLLKRVLVCVHIDDVGWVACNMCKSKSEAWDTINNFTIENLFD